MSAIIIPDSPPYLEAPIGIDRTWQLTIYDSLGNLITTYTSADVLTATVWAGEDQPSLFAPTVAWIAPTSGTISLACAASQTAALAPATYRVRVNLQPHGSGLTLLVFDGALRLTASSGSAAAIPVYCKYQDMLVYADWLEQLADPLVSEDGFLQQRGKARAYLDLAIMRAYRGGNASVFGNDPGGGWAGLWGSRRTPLYSPFIQTALAASQLLVYDDVINFNAYYAIYLVCQAQLGKMGQDAFAKRAPYFRGMASNVISSMVAQIDVNGDGIGDILIPLNTLNTLWS